MTSSFFTYFFMDRCFKQSGQRAIENSRILNLLIRRMEGKPYLFFYMIKVVAVPELIRNMFIGAIGLPKKVLFNANLMYYLILCLKYAIIGSEVREI
jgi:hypothetical protein